jgi:hypothetical protein
LMRLGKDSRVAAEALARFLEGFIRRISFEDAASGAQAASGKAS